MTPDMTQNRAPWALLTAAERAELRRASRAGERIELWLTGVWHDWDIKIPCSVSPRDVLRIKPDA